MFKRVLYTVIFGTIYVGCTNVKFQKDDSFNKCQNSGIECKRLDERTERFDYSVNSGSGIVDILFIDDNSGSMSIEQAGIANKFPDFLNSLGSVDYHIGVITTDVSASPNSYSRAANGFGAWQDGKLIEFSPGLRVLNPTTPDKENLFVNTLKRPETLSCEQNGFGTDVCPSRDERGVYAGYMAVERATPEFFRPAAHLAIVIISDENERSNGGNITGYELEEKDKPDTLINLVKSKFGSTKSFSAHSIIVKPGDNDCLSQQTAYFGPLTVNGFEGTVYAELSQKTNGVIGSICSSDYGKELGNIGHSLREKVNSVKLVCAPIGGNVEVTVTPEPAGLTTSFDSATNTVNFNQVLPIDTTVRVIYDCVHLEYLGL